MSSASILGLPACTRTLVAASGRPRSATGEGEASGYCSRRNGKKPAVEWQGISRKEAAECESLCTVKPDEPIPFDKAVAVGKLAKNGTNQHTMEGLPAVDPKKYGGNPAYIRARLERDAPTDERAARAPPSERQGPERGLLISRSCGDP
jgi:hypothetical protein